MKSIHRQGSGCVDSNNCDDLESGDAMPRNRPCSPGRGPPLQTFGAELVDVARHFEVHVRSAPL
jgi:hypothetical protein